MPFRIERNDITKVRADAIVNSANPRPVIGSGTDSAIYDAAGAEALLAERKKIGDIKPGEACYTSAFRLPARYIIHTVGPVWYGGESDELETLRACYRHSLILADRLNCRSVAFPMISTGVYGFPKDKALRIAIEEISDFLMTSEMDVILVVFDKKAFDLSASVLDGVKQFIDDNYVETYESEVYSRRSSRLNRRELFESNSMPGDAGSLIIDEDLFDMMSECESAEQATPQFGTPQYGPSLYGTPQTGASRQQAPKEAPKEAPKKALKKRKRRKKDAAEGHFVSEAPKSIDDLDGVLKNLGMTFQQKLLDLIDTKGYTDTQVYKRANIDRKLFSKIRCNVNYKPSKATVLALAISLELNLDETVDLLKRAGLALQPSSKSDLIVRYCIDHCIYDIFEVNAILFQYDQQLLGA